GFVPAKLTKQRCKTRHTATGNEKMKIAMIKTTLASLALLPGLGRYWPGSRWGCRAFHRIILFFTGIKITMINE
ncbi:hypothetical protein MJM83_29670, partial [Salmonella enterica subsp. enterica serovar Montevideo]|nr:hypothetical protein [Salmonella enterica subsp. enterica serovar Montevideo]